MKPYVTMGLTVLAGAALLEVALIPGLLIGGAAVLAPQMLPKLRRQKRASGTNARRSGTPAAPASRLPVKASSEVLPGLFSSLLPDILPKLVPKRLGIGQAIAKTITYRIIVTALDFTTNYVVIGELATAAGLSTFNLVAGPVFYLAHEAAWNYFRPSQTTVAFDGVASDAETPRTTLAGLPVSRVLAKTITFRTLATAMDFTTNYVVVGDVATAVLLSATGFVFGPFVYYGHEKAWDYFGARGERTLDLPSDIGLLPAAG